MEESASSLDEGDRRARTHDASVAPPTPADRRRPRPVVIASVALVALGLLGLLVTWVLLSALNDDADHGQSVDSALYTLCYVQFVLSSAQVVSGLLIWRGRLAWARIAAIVICSVNLVGGVIDLFSGSILPGVVNLVMNIALIRLLRNDDVYDWCHRTL